MRPRQRVLLTPSKSSGPPQLLSDKRPASVTHLGSTLLQHRGRGSHLLSTGDPPLCFLTLTKCKFSNSFVLTFIQNAGVCTHRMANHASNQGLAGGGLTSVPEPSLSAWMESEERFSNRSTRPLGQRTCTQSIFVAPPRPKWTRMSLLEM